jgi:FMN phosphatase YigB (HAD superfamily)
MGHPSIRFVFFDIGDTLIVSADRSWVPGAQATLAQLRARGLRLGVISNTGGLKRAELAPLLPADFAWTLFVDELIVLSGEVGVEKPALEIFQLASNRTGATAAECLFCTESLVDTLAAQRAGLYGARLQPPPHSDIGSLTAAVASIDSGP